MDAQQSATAKIAFMNSVKMLVESLNTANNLFLILNKIDPLYHAE